MSLFDPNQLLNEEVTGANSTKIPVIPAGEYPAIVKKLDPPRQQPKKDDPTILFTILDVHFGIDDAGVKEATKMSEPSARLSVFLDLIQDESGRSVLDMGEAKNVQLGRLRAAVGLNNPDVPFSFSQLVGRPCLIRIEHSPNPNDPDSPYSNIKAVTELK